VTRRLPTERRKRRRCAREAGLPARSRSRSLRSAEVRPHSARIYAFRPMVFGTQPYTNQILVFARPMEGADHGRGYPDQAASPEEAERLVAARATSGAGSRWIIARMILFLLLSALPLLAISAHVFGVVSQRTCAMLVIIPLAAALTVVVTFAPHSTDGISARAHRRRRFGWARRGQGDAALRNTVGEEDFDRAWSSKSASPPFEKAQLCCPRPHFADRPSVRSSIALTSQRAHSASIALTRRPYSRAARP
jgi:hypothetical protein